MQINITANKLVTVPVDGVVDVAIKTYRTEITVWSNIGHTPITKRRGAYCDELIRTEIECVGPADAHEMTRNIMVAHPHGARAHFNMPGYWNQNTRSGWL